MCSSHIASQRFHGLFIGLNDFASPAIQRLRFARDDAVAFHALFKDNYGDGARLLRDDEATKASILSALKRIVDVSTGDDLVVITYSGHGSRTHELATYDTDIADLGETALCLEELVCLVERISAKLLIVVLDCCFSGAAASKVLTPVDAPRGGFGMTQSVDTVVTDAMCGGRIIITASAADQEAREHWQYQHGLFTYYVLKGLLGAEEVLESGRVSLLKLLDFVQHKVLATQSGRGQKRQDPTLRGKIDGRVSLPVMRPGRHYRALHKNSLPLPATSDLDSLTRHGISAAVVSAWRHKIESLNNLQIAAINDGGVLTGNNIVVSAPTSSGKTLIGVMAAMRTVQAGRRAIFIVPTRALVSELYNYLKDLHKGIDVHTIRVTGELIDHIDQLMQGSYQIAILTYEKFANLLCHRPTILSGVGALIVDEIQNLASAGRGPSLELLLTLIKIRTITREKLQIVALSGVLGGLDGLDSWLTAECVSAETRPVPLIEGVLDLSGTYQYLDPELNVKFERIFDETPCIDDLISKLAARAAACEQQVIVFCNTRPTARKTAQMLGTSQNLPTAEKTLSLLPEVDLNRETQQLRECLSHGVAFHTAELATEEQNIIEQQFRHGAELRIITTTTTLAQGVNLPADMVIIRDVEHPGPSPYTVSEYKNIAGRAGRTGLTKVGRAVLLARGPVDAQRKWDQYISARPERLRSALSSIDSIDDLLLYAFAALRDSNPDSNEVWDFLAQTFTAHQRRLTHSTEPFSRSTIENSIEQLVRKNLLQPTHAGLRLTPLGQTAAWSGISVDSAIETAEAIKEIDPAKVDRVALIAIAQITTELKNMYFAINSRELRVEQQHTTEFLIRHGLSENLLARALLDDRGTAVIRAKRIMACIAWTDGVPRSVIERWLLRFVRPEHRDHGPVPVQRTAHRTADVMGAILDITRNVHPKVELGLLETRLPTQLYFGVMADMVPVARHAGRALGRQTYCKLISAGLTDETMILNASNSELLTCVGGDRHKLQQLRSAALAAINDQAHLDSADATTESSKYSG